MDQETFRDVSGNLVKLGVMGDIFEQIGARRSGFVEYILIVLSLADEMLKVSGYYRT